MEAHVRNLYKIKNLVVSPYDISALCTRVREITQIGSSAFHPSVQVPLDAFHPSVQVPLDAFHQSVQVPLDASDQNVQVPLDAFHPSVQVPLDASDQSVEAQLQWQTGSDPMEWVFTDTGQAGVDEDLFEWISGDDTMFPNQQTTSMPLTQASMPVANARNHMQDDMGLPLVHASMPVVQTDARGLAFVETNILLKDTQYDDAIAMCIKSKAWSIPEFSAQITETMSIVVHQGQTLSEKQMHFLERQSKELKIYVQVSKKRKFLRNPLWKWFCEGARRIKKQNKQS